MEQEEDELFGKVIAYHRYNIQHVETFAPNATTVINNHYYGEKPKNAPPRVQVAAGDDHEQRLDEILGYVSRLTKHVAEAWTERYEGLWRNLLALPAVSAHVYNPGKQQNTSFNRNLVAHLIYIMTKHGVFTTDNATELAVALEGDKDHSVRSKLGQYPEDARLRKEVESLIRQS